MERNLLTVIKQADLRSIKEDLETLEFQLAEYLELLDKYTTKFEDFGDTGLDISNKLAAIHNKISRQQLQISLMRVDTERSIINFDIDVLEDESND